MKSRLIVVCLISSVAAFSAGSGKHFFRSDGPLTEATGESPEAVGAKFLGQVASQFDVSAAELASVYLVKQYKTGHNGATHLRYRQRYGGIDVAGSDFTINLDGENRILNAGGAIFAQPAAQVRAPDDSSLAASMRSAMQKVDPASAGSYTPMETGRRGALRTFHRPREGDIGAKAVWFPLAGHLEPAWQFILDGAGGVRSVVTVHAGTQSVLDTRALSFFQNPPSPPRGLVFTGESPQPNPRPGFLMTEQPPFVSRVLVSFAGDPQASPVGWVEANETAGNNVIAGKNPLAQYFLVTPVTAKSDSRDFQFPLQMGLDAPNPANFSEASIVNLFYWMNRAHDLFWHIGFNEAAGNYQKQNFGRGGLEGDPVYTYAQFGIQQTFGASLNNAFYTTYGLEDGSPAMIAMFLGAGSNGYFTDGSLDSEVMIHEYTHGVSLRLVPNLSGHHGGAMGEGWSDFFGLEFTLPEGAPPDGVYGVGNFLFQRFNVGSRTRPYSTQMEVNPITFADLGRVTAFPQIHQDAGIWVESLWEMRANLIRQFGETEGRRRTRLLVIDGMKLSIPGPTMVDARDAILLADRVDFNGESQAQIWAAFAKRGLGVTAFAASNNITRTTASSATPSATGILAFSENSYVLGDPVRVILFDLNLEGPVAAVQLTSYETGDLETVRLVRDGPFYTGVVPTNPFSPAARGDGALSVMPGSIISAYYNDARAESGAKLVEISVPMQAPYVRSSRAPAPFVFPNEQPLNLRAGTGSFQFVDLPFPFPFYGRRYSGVQVHANGLLSFDLPPSSACVDAALFRNMTGIAPFYMNMRTSGTAQPNENVYMGRPSEDAVTFRWAGETAVIAGSGVIPEPLNFAVTLYSDGRIEMAYGAGNRNLGFPSPATTALNCSVSPVIGISNGLSNLLVAEYIGRSTLENAPKVLFEPPVGAGSAPEIELEVPNATDTYQGILTGRATIWDQNHFLSAVYVIIDGILRGQAFPIALCQGQGRPNCFVFGWSYNFETLGLQAGPHDLTLRAVNSRGGITDRKATFNIAAGQSRVPTVIIEGPAEGSEVTGNITIRGYAFAENLRIAGIDILIDGISYGRAQYGMPRPEVCSAAGITAPNCPAVGFFFSVNSVTGAFPLPNGEHLLQVRIQDETGRFTTYPENSVRFRVNNALNQPPVGVLATPTHGQRVSGTILIYGYAYDPDGRIETVQLLVDGIIRSTLPYGEARTTECTALPGVAACPNIGFWHQWNTNTVLNGPHVLGIRLLDDRGRAVVVPQNAVNGLTVIVEN